MGRSIYCCNCGEMKEPGRDNESRCKSCKSEANKLRRAKRREEMGMPPFGSGRDPKCYACKAIKEVRSRGYCNACSRKKDQEWRLKNGKTKKVQTGLCPCGKERALYSKSYCIECIAIKSPKWRANYKPSDEVIRRRNERQRIAWHKKHSNKNLKHDPVNEARREKYHDMSPEAIKNRIKHQTRALTRSFIKAGKLKKLPCEVCGKNEKVEAHHDDYDKPMDIRWLCRKHHREHHGMLPCKGD